MAKCILRGGKIIEDYKKPYIIAEVNSSHGGSIDVAKKMIDAAADAGADCVKFQSWNKQSLYSKTYYNQNRLAGRFIEKFSLSPGELKNMAAYCREKNLDFSSTPYSEEEVDFLVNETDAPFIKISSMELNNTGYLRYIGRKHVPVVLSTGMGEIKEIQSAVSVLEEVGIDQLVLLHCVSVYPTSLDLVNLNNIYELREAFPKYPIGFSDHTLGNVAGVAAVALGVGILEKHLTLNKKQIGMDNKMAAEPDELKAYITVCRDAQIAMGNKIRMVSSAELEQRNKMRRSIIAVRDLPKGTVLREADLSAKRPGTGISPDRISTLVGMTVLNNIEADTVINISDLLEGK